MIDKIYPENYWMSLLKLVSWGLGSGKLMQISNEKLTFNKTWSFPQDIRWLSSPRFHRALGLWWWLVIASHPHLGGRISAQAASRDSVQESTLSSSHQAADHSSSYVIGSQGVMIISPAIQPCNLCCPFLTLNGADTCTGRWSTFGNWANSVMWRASSPACSFVFI